MNNSVFEGIQTPSDDQLKELQKKANEALFLQDEIEALELQTKNLKEQFRVLTESSIPDLMSAIGIKKFETDLGAEVKIKDFINGSLPKEPQKRAEALDYLNANNAGDLVKNTFGVKLNKEQQTEAVDLEAYLRALKVDFERKEDVHPQTLAAWARDRMREGVATELETIGLYAGKHAKITRAE